MAYPKEAMSNLAGQFTRFRNRERITVIPFNDQVQDTQNFEIDLSKPESLQSVSNYVNSLQANGKTGIYSALQHTYDLALAAQKSEPDRHYSVVLLSDGENNSGLSKDDFLAYLNTHDPNQIIKTFTILFGEANESDMQGIAQATGGRMFNAGTDPLSLIFKEIRGYQ
jgi:Ca-activated chloride channel homolog